MKSCERYVSPKSDYFVYTPSRTAREMFFYPLQCGRFFYEAGYSLCRESYDSFLLMYLASDGLTLELDGQVHTVPSGSFVLLNCYKRHAYYAVSACECLWCHFDGAAAERWYDQIVSRLGNLFSMQNSRPVLDLLTAVYDVFAGGNPVREPLLSKYLNDILTAFLLYGPAEKEISHHAGSIEKTVTYINEHYAESIPVETMAVMAGLSQYHFIRIFKKETGFTPHEYLLNTRIGAAKYLLKNTRLPIKEICLSTGFSCESVFCTSFKRHQGMTPLQYRTSGSSA